ncbi:MAG: pentapeptide repeat-containing protein [Actinomycetes bacterium]
MSRARRPSPTTPQLDFTPPHTIAATDPESLDRGDSRDGECFADLDLSERDLSHTTFDGCEFNSVTLSSAELRGTRLRHTLMADSFALQLSAHRSTWRDVLVRNPRWGLAEVYEAELIGVHILQGKINYLNLRNSKLTDVLIEDCGIDELDLSGSRARRLWLKNCRIGTLTLAGTDCINVDLRTSQYTTINGFDGLRGTTIDDIQLTLLAPLLAAHLGITVE